MKHAAGVPVCTGVQCPIWQPSVQAEGSREAMKREREKEREQSVECGDADWKTTLAHLLANKHDAIYTAAAKKGLPGSLSTPSTNSTSLNYIVCGQTVIYILPPQ